MPYKCSGKIFFSSCYSFIIYLLLYHHNHLKCVSLNDNARKKDTGLAPTFGEEPTNHLVHGTSPAQAQTVTASSPHKGNKTEPPHALVLRTFFLLSRDLYPPLSLTTKAQRDACKEKGVVALRLDRYH